MEKKSKKQIYQKTIFAIFFISLLFTKKLSAQNSDIIVCSGDNGLCTLQDMINTAINISDFLLGIVAGIALLFFVVAGILMILSSGQQDKIAKGKSMMINSVIGLVICLLSWTTVYFVQTAIGVKDKLSNAPTYPSTQEVTKMVEKVVKDTPRPLICQTDLRHWVCRQKHGLDKYGDGETTYACVEITGTDNVTTAKNSDYSCEVNKKYCPVKTEEDHAVWCCDTSLMSEYSGEVYAGDGKCTALEDEIEVSGNVTWDKNTGEVLDDNRECVKKKCTGY